jgi:hypothetical protein
MTHDYDAHSKIRKLGQKLETVERSGTLNQSVLRKLREEFDEVRRNQYLMMQEQQRMAETIRQLQAQLFPIDKTDKPVLKAPAANDGKFRK